MCFFDKIGKFCRKVSNSISAFTKKLHFTVMESHNFYFYRIILATTMTSRNKSKMF